MIKKIKQFSVINLKGIAQIMLQENAITGLLFLLGVLYNSWLMAIGLVIATITGSVSGYLLSKKNHKALNQGLYGFNAALIGIIIVYKYGLSWESVFCIIVASVIATLIMHFAIIKNLQVFTFPFVVMGWVVVSLVNTTNFMPLVQHPTAEENFLQEPTAEMFEDALEQVGIEYDDDRIDDDLIFSTHGFGQVMFQGSLIAGLLFLFGVYVNKPIAALYGIFASILAISVSHLLNSPESSIDTGMFSFNAVLCALAFAGTRHRDGFWVVLSTVVTVIIDDYLIKIGVPPYTFPFVATMWILLLTRKGLIIVENAFPLKKS
ncbi:urea transporter [Polaribacter sp. IC073]|uniref:urea transporter n=1 Tax=Polaribacter sp. IC073 TaxID=2508540 RepID=UPI0011BE576F|nr:urea transporter [Polaribacter sp. IC073]TXD49444.1 urea transporter [Polaribacter sp. IC073]